MNLKVFVSAFAVSMTFVASVLALPPSLPSGLLSSRAELDAILGIARVTEDFEAFTVPPNPLGIAGFFGPLTSNSIIHGQGPGLIAPGVSFLTQGELQWYDTTAFGGNSKRLSFSSGQAYHISFSNPVSAFGFDFTAIPGTSGSSSMYVYDANGGTAGLFEYATVNDPLTPTFVGFSHPAGIGDIQILTFQGGPIIDNFTFGRVPEPSGLILIAVCAATLLVRHRRQSLLD